MQVVVEYLAILVFIGICAWIDARRRRRGCAANDADCCGSCGVVLQPHSQRWIAGYNRLPLWRVCQRCARRDARQHQLAAGLLALLVIVVVSLVLFTQARAA